MQRHIRMCFLFVLIGLPQLLPYPSTAQDLDGALARMPNDAAIYVWTEDLPDLVHQLWNVLGRDSTDFDRLFQYPEEWTLDRDGFKQQNEIERIEAFAQLLQCLNEEIVEGPALWVRHLVDEDQDAEVFLIRSNAEAEQIEEIVALLNQLADPTAPFSTDNLSTQAERENSSDSTTEENLGIELNSMGNLPGYWGLKGGWLCIGSNPDLVVRDLAFAIGDSTTRFSIESSRSFQTIFRNLSSDSNRAPTISVYVPPEAWPSIATWSRRLNHLNFAGIYSPIWLCIVHDIRGLGGNIYLRSTDEDDHRNPMLFFDALTIVPEPRAELLTAFDPRGRLEYDLPVMPETIGAWFQLLVDGEKVASGLAELPDRHSRVPVDLRELFKQQSLGYASSASNGYPSNDRSNPELLSKLEDLFRPIDQFSYLAAQSAPSRFHRFIHPFEPLLYLHSPRQSHAVEAIENYLSGDTSLTTRTNLYERLTWEADHEDDQLSLWQTTADSRASELDRVERSWESTLELNQRHRDEVADDPQKLREVNRSIANYMKLFAQAIRANREAVDAFWMANEGWYLPHPIHVEFLESLRERRTATSHPQVMELHQSIEAIENLASSRTPTIGFVSIWGDHLRIMNRIIDGSDPERGEANPNDLFVPDLANATDAWIKRAIEWERTRQLKTLLLRDLSRVVILFRDEERGIRLNGGVFLHDPPLIGRSIND